MAGTSLFSMVLGYADLVLGCSNGIQDELAKQVTQDLRSRLEDTGGAGGLGLAADAAGFVTVHLHAFDAKGNASSAGRWVVWRVCCECECCLYVLCVCDRGRFAAGWCEL
jgi:hypothetical protein